MGKDWIAKQALDDEARRKKGVKRVSAIVANHIGWTDEIALLNIPEFKPSFTPAAFVETLPIADYFVKSLQGIYIDRD